VAEDTDDHLFEEIEEDLRAERYAKLWKRYGKFVIAGFVALIVGVAGFKGWQTYDQKIRAEQSNQYATAARLLAEKKSSEAEKLFAALAKDGSQGYRFLSGLRTATLLKEKGDSKGAQSVYDSIAADTGHKQLYRDLATLLSVMAMLDKGEPTSLKAQLAPLLAKDNPWRFSAQEASALLSLRAGKQKQAYDLLLALSNDAATPQGIRNRAQELSAAIKP